jgi:hypothetical protein
LKNREVTIEVLGMGSASSPFDHAAFYEDILPKNDQDSSTFNYRTFESSAELMQCMRRTFHPKRSLVQLRWRLFEGHELAVRLYSLVTETKVKTYSKQDKRSGRVVVPVTKYFYKVTFAFCS